jgi:hypothetical protein
MTIGSLAQTNVSTTHSFKTIRASRGGHRWSFSLDYPPGMTRSDVNALWAFLVSQSGQLGSFDFTAPYQTATGSMAGSPVVDGADQTGNVINLRGFTASQTGVLKAGDYIRIAGQYKAYLVVEDADSDGSGEAAVTIHPAIQTPSPADGAAITAAGLFRCRLANDYQEMAVSTILHYGLSVELVEALD